jgi:hypothetical protein
MPEPKLYINVYQSIAHDHNNERLPAPMTPSLMEQELAITATPVTSKPLPSSATFVCLVAEEDCFVSFGYRPEDEDRCFIQAGERLYFGVMSNYKIIVQGDQQ